MTAETPKVKLPRITRFMRATGALRVCVTGYDHAKNEFIYTTQFRCWHPVSWLVGFFTAQISAIAFFIGSFLKMEWRASNG